MTTPRYSDLCRELFLLAQDHDLLTVPGGPAQGRRWELRIAGALARRGFPVRSVAAGVQVHGVLPASGLRHQVDAAIACGDALVVGEWKAWRAPVPKNEVLRFKAVSDDLYEAMSRRPPERPFLRLFGMAGDARPELRAYAARHGIALVERSRWPVPVVIDHTVPWPADEGPTRTDLEHLGLLSRPLQGVYPLLPDGSMRVLPPLGDATVRALLGLHDYWSDRLWDLVGTAALGSDSSRMAA